MDTSDIVRLAAAPGMHGAHCARCDYLFDAFNTPQPLNDAIMRMEGMKCPRCRKRDKLFLMMPSRYRAAVADRVEDERRREAVRLVADKYIQRT